jgi:hypothetical protein
MTGDFRVRLESRKLWPDKERTFLLSSKPNGAFKPHSPSSGPAAPFNNILSTHTARLRLFANSNRHTLCRTRDKTQFVQEMNDTTRKVTDVVWPILGVIAVILICFLAPHACVMMTMPIIANQIQLGEVRAGHQSIPAVWPHGHHHEMLLGVPGAEWEAPPVFTASVQFVDGGQVSTEFVVDSSRAESCNWLDSDDIQGFILTWPNTNEWEHSLVPGRPYVIKCEFVGDMPTNSSLWVSCLQSGIDRWKTRRNRTKP